MICCAVVPSDPATFHAQSLRRSLADRLPAYMLPALWLSLDALPLNDNGKVDRPELRRRFQERAQAVAAPALAG